MIINHFEEKDIKKSQLPKEWQTKENQEDLEKFLQENWEQRHTLYFDESTQKKQGFLEFKAHETIRTKGYVGTISFKGQQLNIFPKIFRESFEDNNVSNLSLEHLMKNLVQWLDYCHKFDYPYLNIKSELKNIDNLKELFITVFVNKLYSCLEKNNFFQYEDKTEDLSSIKGKFNIKDFYTNKYSRCIINRFNCTYSSFEYNNLLNQIIKYTCKRIINDTRKINQQFLRKILNRLSNVNDVKCTAKDCEKVKIGKMHSEYRMIISMCKMFLLNESTTYSVNNIDSFCFLFPTNLLFEGFIGGFMKEVIKDNGKITLQASDEYLINEVVWKNQNLGEAFQMRHDILCEIEEKGLFVLDTKYKQLKRFESSAIGGYQTKKDLLSNVDQKDLYQITTYAVKRGITDAYLLYPLFRKEDLEPGIVTLKQVLKVFGNTIDSIKIINIHLVRMPFVFEDDIEDTKLKLKKVIEEMFIN